MKKLKNVISVFCAALLLISAAVPPARAQNAPTLSFTSNTVTIGGGSAYCFLQMRGAENIAAMDYLITYDSENLELAANYTTGFTDQGDVTVSINDSEPGEIRVMLVSQNGFNGSNYLNLLYFKAKANAKPGVYPISVLVNDIYNTALETVIANKQSGKITVKESSQTVKSVRFSSTLSASTLQCGENLNYKLNISSLNGLSAGALDFTYDESKLYLGNVTLSDAMKNTVYDVNTDMPGLVKVSFASENAVASGSDAIALDFTALSAGKSEIGFKPSELYDNEFNSMSGNELVKTITVAEPTQTVDYPDFKISVPEIVPSDKEFTIKAILEGNSGVRAGDFTLQYDSGVLECLGVSAQASSGAWVVTDKNYSNGEVKFSLMSNIDLAADTTIVEIRLKSKENADSKSVVSLSGTGVYDADFKEVMLDYKRTQINVIRPEYTVNFYDSDGETLIFTQKVMSGNSAIPPEMQSVRTLDKTVHLKFDGWDKDFSVISDNTDFVAVYAKETHTEVSSPSSLPGIDTPGFDGGTECVVCGEVLREGSIIPPTGAIISADLNKNGILNITGAISDNKQAENSVLLSVYSAGELLKCVDISTYDQSNFALEMENMACADTVKIFRWESLSSLKPIGSVISEKVHYSYPVIAATLSEDSTLTVSGKLSESAAPSGCVLVGIYSDEKFLNLYDISSQNQNKISLTVDNMPNADTVKVFRWNSLENLMPTSDAILVKVSKY